MARGGRNVSGGGVTEGNRSHGLSVPDAKDEITEGVTAKTDASDKDDDEADANFNGRPENKDNG